MLLKYGIKQDDGTVKVITIDNIIQIEEQEAQEIETERLTKIIRNLPETLQLTYKKFDFVYDKSIQFGYLLNDNGDTIKVLKYDDRTGWFAKNK